MKILDQLKQRIFQRYEKHSDATYVASRRFPNARLESNVQIKGNLDNLHLGSRVYIQNGSVLHLGGMDWCENTGRITIGEGSVISPYCVIYGCGSGGVTIGKNCDCGPYVGIFASRTDYTLGPGQHIFKPVTIGDDVIIYSHCTISPGITIGSRATIAAGSVVTEDIPEDCLVGGTPAHILKVDARHRTKQNLLIGK